MSWRVCSKSRVKMSGHNPKNSAEHLVFSVSPLERFLRVGFQKKNGLGVKNILGKKWFLTKSIFRQSHSPKYHSSKKSNTPSRGIIWLKILLKTGNTFEEYFGSYNRTDQCTMRRSFPVLDNAYCCCRYDVSCCTYTRMCSLLYSDTHRLT